VTADAFQGLGSAGGRDPITRFGPTAVSPPKRTNLAKWYYRASANGVSWPRRTPRASPGEWSEQGFACRPKIFPNFGERDRKLLTVPQASPGARNLPIVEHRRDHRLTVTAGEAEHDPNDKQSAITMGSLGARPRPVSWMAASAGRAVRPVWRGVLPRPNPTSTPRLPRRRRSRGRRTEWRTQLTR
jgi:hypothetical protein